MSVLYTLEDLRVRFGAAEILHGLTFTLRQGDMTAIAGPNGAGKSTLMHVLSGVMDRYHGSCRFHQKEIRRWNKRELAREAAFIPQMVRLEFPFTAEQVVFMGRAPYGRGIFETEEDVRAVRQAMEITDVTKFARREFRSLSGGERQRVILAGALAQEPSVLLLDEPTTFLDLKHQIETYSLLQRLAREGVSVIAVTHDLNLASSYADRIVLLANGCIAADGTPDDVLRPDLVREVFEVDVEIRPGAGGRPWIVYESALPAAASTQDRGTRC